MPKWKLGNISNESHSYPIFYLSDSQCFLIKLHFFKLFDFSLLYQFHENYVKIQTFNDFLQVFRKILTEIYNNEQEQSTLMEILSSYHNFFGEKIFCAC